MTVLKEALEIAGNEGWEVFILNGGSNVLLTRDRAGLVIKLEFKGIEILKEDEDYAWVKVATAENWHQFVLWTLDEGFGGLENLSLIPGNAGTAPMQNIGAYGVEIKDTMVELSALDRETGEIRIFKNEECNFGYRDSVFKNIYKDRYVILDVTFKLTKKNHALHTSYGAIRSELEREGIQNPSIRDISNAVIKIRQSKLPDPKKIGNAGSFFKNPVIPKAQFEKLREAYPDIPGYPAGDKIKTAAGWLIDRAGWKGKRFGDAGVHDRQALVLVNHGNAVGKEIYELSEKIVKDIEEKFGIRLEREVNVY